MAGVRFPELQSRPMEFLDFTSVTLDQQFPLMACASYTTYVGGSLYGQFAIPFIGFDAPRVIEGTPHWKSSSFRSLPRRSSALAMEPE
jgi:hypothetical protein